MRRRMPCARFEFWAYDGFCACFCRSEVIFLCAVSRSSPYWDEFSQKDAKTKQVTRAASTKVSGWPRIAKQM